MASVQLKANKKEKTAKTAPSPSAGSSAASETLIEKVNYFAERIIYKLAMRWERATSMDLFITAELAELCYRAREVLWADPICLKVEAPICVVGDIHGQFDDLLGMFDITGWPFSKEEIQLIKAQFGKKGTVKGNASEKTKKTFSNQPVRYLFLGDYVDRGAYSVEVVTLLFALKVRWPDRIFMLRGNHESRPVNHHYGFYTEVKYRYGEELYDLFQVVFNVLPFCAIINDRIMCMHGGISSHFVSIEQFLAIKRPVEIPDVGILADLTWADPDPTIDEYAPSQRGASFVFGKVALRKFLDRHGLDLIVRGHQVVEDGYEFFDERRLVTIFSAPNYCGQSNNTACILVVDSNLETSMQLFRPETRDATHKK